LAVSKDDDPKFRLRPPKPRARSERPVWSMAYKIVLHHARMTGRRLRRSAGVGSGVRRSRPYNQRCAVRITYAKNTTAGLWRAHGRYIARESAASGNDSRAAGFDGSEESVNIAERLKHWQKASDERLWKLIVSPEFGDRIDLKGLTRDLMLRMEADLAMPLDWVAVTHHNTDHPHVHIALRGHSIDGSPIHLSREYIQHGIRSIAEDLCTRQLGYRSQHDAEQAQRREVHECRYTSLDRMITRQAAAAGGADRGYFSVVADPIRIEFGNRGATAHLTARLRALESMGLAESYGSHRWRVRHDFENVLRAMQRTADHQKMLAAHGVAVSDDRLRLTILSFRQLTRVEGRILVHGEEDAGQNYLLLEGTDGQIHHIYHTPEMAAFRARGGLRTNSFIRLRKVFSKDRPTLQIDELGDADSILRNKRYLRETARRLVRRGILPQEDGWGGWLGKYQKALRTAALDLERESVAKPEKHRDLGR
jgi:type IV secretory pathway VirD2 relaxase